MYCSRFWKRKCCAARAARLSDRAAESRAIVPVSLPLSGGGSPFAGWVKLIFRTGAPDDRRAGRGAHGRRRARRNRPARKGEMSSIDHVRLQRQRLGPPAVPAGPGRYPGTPIFWISTGPAAEPGQFGGRPRRQGVLISDLESHGGRRAQQRDAHRSGRPGPARFAAAIAAVVEYILHQRTFRRLVVISAAGGIADAQALVGNAAIALLGFGEIGTGQQSGAAQHGQRGHQHDQREKNKVPAGQAGPAFSFVDIRLCAAAPR